MPASGGPADKLCNRYETLWAIDQLLQIVDGAACELTPEPMDPDESRGVEFVVFGGDSLSYYWSVKRQTTKAAGWTLAALSTRDDRGRSILGDLLGHVERDPNHRGVFASTLGSRDFEELRDHAETKAHLEARLKRAGKLKECFDNYIMPLCGSDPERARAFLLRTKTHAADEAHLRDQVVNFKIRKLLCTADGSPLDVDAARGYLADLLLDKIHIPIHRQVILDVLATHGVQVREWARERSVRERIEEMRQEYTTPLQSQRINNTLLSLTDLPLTPDPDGESVGRNLLVVAGAGGGKSTTLASMVETLCGSGVPVLPIRFDQLPEGILTTTELGRKLLLPESPVLVLAGVADGSASVLVIDQLDAGSLASGRRAELWLLFESILREVRRFPNMSVMVGCRDFDLEHDDRLRTLKAEGSGFQLVKLKLLSMEQVDSALRDGGLDPAALQPTLKAVLSVPLHLSMFLRLDPGDRAGVGNREELFDKFWTDAERRAGRRLGRTVAWTQVIDKLANWLSANQQLSAPEYVLDEFSADAAAMASEHVLLLADGRYRFFHESFFDYAFARRFAAQGGRVVNLLFDGEQHLFRRAQVRQILSYLRTQGEPRYLEELWGVLSKEGVRFHIKRLVLEWLATLPDPRRQEWDLLQKLIETGTLRAMLNRAFRIFQSLLRSALGNQFRALGFQFRLHPSLGPKELRSHIRGVIQTRTAWFDVIDSSGFFDSAFASGDETREQEAVWILGLHSTLETRSARVAELLRHHRKSNEQWDRYLRQVCRRGDVYHSREMFDLFLSLIDDGTLDDVHSGFAVNDNWWNVLYRMGKNRPDLACEAIARWFDRALATWKSNEPRPDGSSDVATSAAEALKEHLNSSGQRASVIRDAANSPRNFAEQMLPRIAELVGATAKECRDRLQLDPFCNRGNAEFDGSESCRSSCAPSLSRGT